MSQLIFDTSILIDIERGIAKTTKQIDRMRGHPAAKITFATHAEYYYGALRKEGSPKRALSALKNYEVVQSDAKTNETAAIVRRTMEKRGTPLGPMDVFIAASCLAHDAILITKDKHFSNVPDLNILLIE